MGQDSIVYTSKMDSMAIHCLLNQQAKDTIIKSQGRQIESLQRERLSDSLFLDVKIKEVNEYTNKLNKCRKSSRLKSYGFSLLGLLIGLALSRL